MAFVEAAAVAFVVSNAASVAFAFLAVVEKIEKFAVVAEIERYEIAEARTFAVAEHVVPKSENPILFARMYEFLAD